MDEYTTHGSLKELFTKRLDDLMSSLNASGSTHIKIKSQVTKPFASDEIEFIISHPSDRYFDIVVTISDEIVVAFSDFHTHHNNIPDERPLEQVIEDAIDQIRLILTADRVIVTKWLKRKGVYKNVLEVEHHGQKDVIEDFYIGFRGLLFFFPTTKVVTTTTFK